MKPRTPITTRTVGFAPRVAPLPPAAAKLSPPRYVRLDAEDQRAKVRDSTRRADYEGGWQRIVVPSDGNARVFSTTRRWRGIDVYVERPNFSLVAGDYSFLRIKVYAVIEGLERVLVGTGIYAYITIAGTDPEPSTWVCGVRCAADRFDVEISHNRLPTDPGVDVVNVGVIASDELVDVPPMLGAAPIGVALVGATEVLPVVQTGLNAISPAAGDPGFEIVSVHGTAIAAPRWLHVFDAELGDIATLAANPPIYSLGMPTIGSSVALEQSLRARRFRRGLCLIPSSTGNVATFASGDVAYQAFFR